MPIPADWLAAYVLAVSLIAAVLTVADKRRAKRGQWRIPESTLLFTAALGGAAAMLAVMRWIRHKTRHRKFMWGLPAMLLVQVAVLSWLFAKGWVIF